MLSPREQQISVIEAAIGDRKLFWFGTRGQDALGLMSISQFSGSYAVTAPLAVGSLAENVALEELTGIRVDLDTYDIDLDRSPELADLRRRLLPHLGRPSILLPYRSYEFTTNLWFATRETCHLAGLHHDHQAMFEHKPWVETMLQAQLKSIGVKVIPWSYVADENYQTAASFLDDGAVMLRASRRAGGVGLARVEREEDLDELWPREPEQFLAVGPYLDVLMPLNVGGCVFADGTVTVHPASVQLIGIPELNRRAFGYCGNDFGVIKVLDDHLVGLLNRLVLEVGVFLHEWRYTGAFGVDALVTPDGLYFAELNARFQGSTAGSVEIARRLDVPDILLDHIAASLGLAPSRPGVTLDEWTRAQATMSTVVMHNLSDVSQRLVSESTEVSVAGLADANASDLRPREALTASANAALARLWFDRSVTGTGFDLKPAPPPFSFGGQGAEHVAARVQQ